MLSVKKLVICLFSCLLCFSCLLPVVAAEPERELTEIEAVYADVLARYGQNIAVTGIQCGPDEVTVHISPLVRWMYADAEEERYGGMVNLRSTWDGWVDFGRIYRDDLYGNGIPRRYPENISFELFVLVSAASLVLLLVTFGTIGLVRFVRRRIKKLPKPTGKRVLRTVFLCSLGGWVLAVAATTAIWSWSRPSDEELLNERIYHYDDTTRIIGFNGDMQPYSAEYLNRLISLNGRHETKIEILRTIMGKYDFLINAEELKSVTDAYLSFYQLRAAEAEQTLEEYLTAVGKTVEFNGEITLYSERSHLFYRAMMAREIAAYEGITVTEANLAAFAGEEPSYAEDSAYVTVVGDYLLSLAGIP